MGDTVYRQDAITSIFQEADRLEDNGAIPMGQGARAMAFVVQGLPSAGSDNGLSGILRGKTPEEQYDFMDWLLNDYGRQFTNTRQAVVDWLTKLPSAESDVANCKQITCEFDPEVEQWFRDIVQKELSDWQKVVLTNLLPSTEPEIIRCKDCKYNTSSHKCINPDSFFLIPKDDDFCSLAERREDE